MDVTFKQIRNTLVWCFLICQAAAFGQPAFVRLGVNEFSFVNEKIDGNIQDNETNGLMITPVVGYYHYLGKHFGMGIVAGKNFQAFNSTEAINVANNNASNTAKIKDVEQKYYLGLELFQEFYFENYIITLGAVMDLNHIYSKTLSYKNIYEEPDQQHEAVNTLNTVWPTIFKFGVHFKPSIYRRVFKRLYIGLELKWGLLLDYRTGESSNIRQEYLNGVQTLNEVNNQYFKNVILLDFTKVGFGLNFMYRF